VLCGRFGHCLGLFGVGCINDDIYLHWSRHIRAILLHAPQSIAVRIIGEAKVPNFSPPFMAAHGRVRQLGISAGHSATRRNLENTRLPAGPVKHVVSFRKCRGHAENP